MEYDSAWSNIDYDNCVDYDVKHDNPNDNDDKRTG